MFMQHLSDPVKYKKFLGKTLNVKKFLRHNKLTQISNKVNKKCEKKY